jgi:hypothetical protein
MEIIFAFNNSGSVAIKLFTLQQLHLILVGAGVLVYQFVVYPFIVKYFGPISPLRPAAVCEKYNFVRFASVFYL